MSKAALRLLSKSVAERTLKPLLDAGVTENYFPNPVDREVFRDLNDAHIRYGKLPSLKQLKMDHEDYTFIKVEDDFDLLIDRLRAEYTGSVLSMTINAAAEGYDQGEFEAATSSLRAGLASIDDIHSSMSQLRIPDLLSLAEKWEYDRTHAKAGVPFGITAIDHATGGIADDQLVTLIGTPGTGKSAHLLHMALSAAKAGFRALFITIEMSDEHHLKRAVAHYSGVEYWKIQRGKPSDKEKRAIEATLQQIHEEDNLHVREIPADSATLGKVKDLIDKINPDCIYIDGAYLMSLPNVRRDAAQWERMSALTREMKAIVLKNHRRIVLTTQASENKLAGKEIVASSTAYSQSFHQDSDIMIGIQQDAEIETRQILKVLKYRDGEKPHVTVEWNWELYRLSQWDGEGIDGAGEQGSFG